jgi:hypothetical protein
MLFVYTDINFSQKVTPFPINNRFHCKLCVHQPEINGIQLILIFCTLDTWNMIVFPFSVSQVLAFSLRLSQSNSCFCRAVN